MLPNIFWSRTDYISGAYSTKMVAISSPAIVLQGCSGSKLCLLWKLIVFSSDMKDLSNKDVTPNVWFPSDTELSRSPKHRPDPDEPSDSDKDSDGM